MALVTDPNQEIAIRLQDRFLLALGEWFLDTRIGVPYFQVVFVKNPDVAAIRALFRKVIETTPGIVSVTELSTNYDPAGRTLTWSFTATTDNGATISGGSGQPFIVT